MSEPSAIENVNIGGGRGGEKWEGKRGKKKGMMDWERGEVNRNGYKGG